MNMTRLGLIDPGEAAGGSSNISADQAEYLADMVAELRGLAENAGLTTLASILALAQVEAAQQSAARRKAIRSA